MWYSLLNFTKPFTLRYSVPLMLSPIKCSICPIYPLSALICIVKLLIIASTRPHKTNKQHFTRYKK